METFNTDHPALFENCPDFTRYFKDWFKLTYPGFNIDAFMQLGFNLQVGVLLQCCDHAGLNVECYKYYTTDHFRTCVHENDEFKPDEFEMMIEYFGDAFKGFEWFNNGGITEFKTRQQAMYIAVHLAMMDFDDYILMINKESKHDDRDLKEEQQFPF